MPTGFSDTLLFNVSGPTAIAFTPDGRMLITTQGGALRVVTAGGSLVATPAVTVPNVCTNSERGLLGVAVDPCFAINHFIYLYYTTSATGTCRNRVSRWKLNHNNVASGEFVLIDRIHSTAGNHNGGDLNFGIGGLLYASVGDGGCDYATPTSCAGDNDATRDHNVLLGKILRVDRNGNIPAGNPFTGPGTGRCNVNGSTTPGDWCQETFAWGLRNPYRFAFDPNTWSSLHQRCGAGAPRRDRPGSSGRRLRLERPRGDLRQPLARTRQLRQPSARRHDQPDIRLRPQRGMHHDHRRRVRAQWHQLAGRVHGQVPVRRLRVRQDLQSRSQRPERHPRRLRHRPRIRERGPPRVRSLRIDPGALLHHLRRWWAGAPHRLYAGEHRSWRADDRSGGRR